MTPDVAQNFVAHSRKLLTASYLPRIERCLEKLSDRDVWWRANPQSNSIGNLLLHLNGNVRQWIVSGVGGATNERDRQREFDERGPIPASELLSRLKNTLAEADRVLAGITPAGLLEDRTIQGHDVTVMEAIYHVVEHFSMHTGQVILLTKMWTGDLGFYDTSDGTPRAQYHVKRSRALVKRVYPTWRKFMFKRILVAVALCVSSAIAPAQQRRELSLRGDRFTPLTGDQLTPEQKTMVNDLLSGTRTSLNGPFNVLLRSPEMGNLAQKLGEYVRFHTSVPKRLNEMAILMTAKWWSSQYEWYAHKTLALEAGLNPAVIDDIQAGRRPARMQADEAVIYDFSTELREHRRVSDATYKAALTLLGEKGVVDLVGGWGYYDLVSMVLNVDRYPLVPGTQLPFPEPK